MFADGNGRAAEKDRMSADGSGRAAEKDNICRWKWEGSREGRKECLQMEMGGQQRRKDIMSADGNGRTAEKDKMFAGGIWRAT